MGKGEFRQLNVAGHVLRQWGTWPPQEGPITPHLPALSFLHVGKEDIPLEHCITLVVKE